MFEIVLLGFILLIASYYIFGKRSALTLPGPRGLPLVGYGPFLSSEPFKDYMKLTEKYGPIFKLQLGPTDWVIINSKDLIQEALVKNGKFTSGRVHNAMIDAFAKGKAQPFAEGKLWKTLREFDVKALKSFGSRAMELVIREEAEHLCSSLEGKTKKAIDCETPILMSVCNVACRITMGRRYEYDDPYYHAILKAVVIFASGDKRARHFGDILKADFLRFFPGYRESYRNIELNFEDSRDEIRRRLQERKRNQDEHGNDDMMNKFLSEIEKRGENDPVFTEDQLIFALQDILSASSDTTTSTLRWCIVGLSTDQAHQSRMYREIEDVIERRGYISIEDQPYLPFTMAYIQEILRYCVPLPLSLPHRVTEDFKLGGYHIPANTPIITNFWAVHRDGKIFENPDKFLPERFLDEEGNYSSKEEIFTFSAGSRRCLGEQLGRMELFFFLTHLIAKFKILPDENGPKMKLDEGRLSISFAPDTFLVRLRSRNISEVSD